MTNNKIHIKIKIDGDTKNLALTRQEVNKLGLSLNNADTIANVFRSSMGKLAMVGITLGSLPQIIGDVKKRLDDMANVAGRLKLVTSSTQELKKAQEELFKISNQTRVSFTSSVDLYARLGRSLKGLDIPQNNMLKVTEAISKSLIVSGASATSAEAALVQLGQGLAADALRGQELNSVMEQTPRLAEAIAKGLNVGLGELREMAKQGKLTAETVFNAILSQKDVLESEFVQMPKTIDQSMTVLGNSFSYLLGQVNDSTKGTHNLSEAIIRLSRVFVKNSEPITIFFTDIKRAFDALSTRVAHHIVKLQTWIEYIKYANYVAGSYINISKKTREKYDSLAEKSSTKIDELHIKSDLLIEKYKEIVSSYGKLGKIVDNSNKSTNKTSMDIAPFEKEYLQVEELNKKMQERINKTLHAKEEEIRKINEFYKQNRENWLKAGKSITEFEKAKAKEIQNINKKYAKSRIKSTNETNQHANTLMMEHYKRINDVVKLSSLKREEYEKKVLKIHKAGSEAYKTYMTSYDQMIKTQKETLKDNTLLKYYELTGKKQKAWAIKEKQIIKEFKGLHVKQLKEVLQKEKERYLKVEKIAKKSFDEISTYWDNITSSMGQSIEDNFFNYFKNGFKDLKGMFKNLGRNLLANFTNPLYRGMSKAMASMLMPRYAGGGKTVASIAKEAGLSLINGQWQGGGDTDGKANIIMSSAGEIIKGKELIASMSGGNEILSSLSNLSSANSVLNFLSNPMGSIKGLTNFFTNPLSVFQNPINSLTSNFLSAGTYLHGLGLGSAGGFIGGLGTGINGFFGIQGANLGLTSGMGGAYLGAGTDLSVLSGSGAYNFGTIAGGALAGAAVGGLGGLLGDKLFGADTYASTTGAIGGLLGGGLGALGAFGAASGPIGWAITGVATLLGGLFGKWKVKDKGIEVFRDIYKGTILDESVMQNFIYSKKKSWFKSKSRTQFEALTNTQYKEIQAQIQNLASILQSAGALGAFKIPKGHYSGDSFFEEILPKSMISSMMSLQGKVKHIVTQYFWGVKKTLTEIKPNPKIKEVYEAWKAYAKSIDKSVMEAMSESLQSIINTKRNFTEWTLKDDSLALASYRASYLQADATAIAKGLGVNFANLTAENFLDKYNEAIRETFDPKIVKQWNALSEAFVKATDAQEKALANLEERIKKREQDMHNAKVALMNAQGSKKYASNSLLEADLLKALKDGGGIKGRWEKTIYPMMKRPDPSSLKFLEKNKDGKYIYLTKKYDPISNYSIKELLEYFKVEKNIDNYLTSHTSNETKKMKILHLLAQMQKVDTQLKAYETNTKLALMNSFGKDTTAFMKSLKEKEIKELAKNAGGIMEKQVKRPWYERHKGKYKTTSLPLKNMLKVKEIVEYFSDMERVKKYLNNSTSTLNTKLEFLNKIAEFKQLENSSKKVETYYPLDLNDRLTPFNEKLNLAKQALHVTSLTTKNLNTALKAVNNTTYTSQDALNTMNKHISILDQGLAEIINKAKQNFDDLTKKVSQTASSLSSVYNTSKSVIDKLRNNDSNFVKNQYAHFLKEARHYQDKLKADIYDTKSASKFSEAVSNLSGYVDEYLNKDNFDTKYDYEFNKSVVANQFDNFKKTASVHDKLKEVVNELKDVKEELKTQSDIQEKIATLEKRVSDVIEGIANGSVEVKTA